MIYLSCRVKELRGESDPRLSNNNDSEPSPSPPPLSSSPSPEPQPSAPTVLEAHVAPAAQPIQSIKPIHSVREVHVEEDEHEKLDKNHIREFLHWHQVEVHGNELQLNEAKKLIEDFSLDLENANLDMIQYKYTKYKQTLEDLLHRKVCFIENLKNRIKKELVDEQEL